MNRLLFGTAGIPMSVKGAGTTVDGIATVRELDLACMELEFVHSVNISREKAHIVLNAAKENNIVLTCHGQYYINLNSSDAAKAKESAERVLKAARIASLCGAWSLCFHAAFYGGMENEKVYATVKNALEKIVSQLEGEGHKLWIRPETTGKPTQFGGLDELLRLSAELEKVMPCIDFSHLHARSGGKYNTYQEFSSVLEKIEYALGKAALRNMHIHVSGIAYGPKGEKHHLNLKECDFNYQDLLKALRDFNACGTLISESPNIEQDALLMQKFYEDLR